MADIATSVLARLAEPFKAAVDNTNFTAKWTALDNKWK